MFTATVKTLDDSNKSESEAFETLDGAKFWVNVQLTGHGYHRGVVRDSNDEIVARADAYLSETEFDTWVTHWYENPMA